MTDAPRRSAREKSSVNYAEVEEGISIPLTSDFYFLTPEDMPGHKKIEKRAPATRWTPVAEDACFDPYSIRSVQGSELNAGWAHVDGLVEPFLVPDREGLGLTVPDAGSFSARRVADIIGAETPVGVLDVATQEELPGWTLGRWAEYHDASGAERRRMHRSGPLSVASLEFSSTPLSRHVCAPLVVRQIDWTTRGWPATLRARGFFPRGGHCCCMSGAGAFHDFRLSAGGASCWRHVLRGREVVLFVPPSDANLQRYREWCESPSKDRRFFGDVSETCHRVVVSEGQTLFLPCGWIYATFHPVDALVFGGHFLHGHAADGQLIVHELAGAKSLDTTNKPAEQLIAGPPAAFPLFRPMMFYAAAYTLVALRAEEERYNLQTRSCEGNDEEAEEAPERLPILSTFECAGMSALVGACRKWHTEAPRKKLKDGSVGGGEDDPATLAASLCGFGSTFSGLRGQDAKNDGGPLAMFDELDVRVSLQTRLHGIAGGGFGETRGGGGGNHEKAAEHEDDEDEDEGGEDDDDDVVVKRGAKKEEADGDRRNTQFQPKLKLSLKSSSAAAHVPAPESAPDMAVSRVKLKLKLSAASAAAPVAVAANGGASSFANASSTAPPSPPSPPPHHPPSPVLDAAIEASSKPPAMPKIKLRLAHSAGKVSTSSSATASSTLPTNTRLLNVEANDVACSVDGCGVIDINQRLVPFWRRRVTACITSDDINATTSRSSTSSAVPEHWSIRRQQGHSDHRQVSGTSSSGSSEATATAFVRLFPICAEHERERREWQAAHGAPPRLSGPLARLVDAYDEAAKPPPSGNVKVDPGARRAAKVAKEAMASLPPSFEERLVFFYTKYEPSKIENIPKIVQKYEGNEEKLFRILVKKYGPEPSKAGNPQPKKRKQGISSGGEAPPKKKKEPRKPSFKETLAKKMKSMR